MLELGFDELILASVADEHLEVIFAGRVGSDRLGVDTESACMRNAAVARLAPPATHDRIGASLG